MLELIIANDLDNAMPLVNISNFEELKAELMEQMQRYNSLIVTEDTVQDAKEFRANLNKLKEALETRRKEIKNQCMQPYNSVEPQFKELAGLIDAPIKAIDSQVKEFDERKKEDKRNKIYDMYDAIVPETIKGIMPITRIWDKKWTNVSTSMESIRAEIIAAADKVANDLMALERVEPEHLSAVKLEYFRTFDLGAALRYADALTAAAKAQMKAQPTVNPPAEKKPPEKPVTAPEPPVNDDKVYSAKLKVRVTLSQWQALTQYMNDNGIEFTRIKED